MNAQLKVTPITREQWLNECADLILDEIIRPVWKVRKNLKIKVSVGFGPSMRVNSKKSPIGFCFNSKCSEDGFSEIFIVPKINDSAQVLHVLVHELIHAVDDCKHGHRGPFIELMHLVGLEGKPTATVAGPKLAAHLAQYIDLLGPIPHAKMNFGLQPKQTNRNLLVKCDCGFKFNTSKMQIELVLAQHGEIICCSCANPMEYPQL